MNLVLWLSWGTAQARDPNCPELYVWQFRALIAAVDEEYSNLEFRRAQMLLDAAGPRVPCVVQVVPTPDLAEFALRRAYAFALDLDENEAQRWAQLAFALQPDLGWPSYVPPDHAARALLEGIEIPKPVTVDGVGLVLPQAGGAFVDGRFVALPEAEPGVPHLLQVGDGTGTLVFSDWIDGATFPDELLGPVPETLPTLPRWYSPDGKVRRAPRPWTPARLHRLESSAGFAIAAGALYGTALLAREAYDERTTDGLRYTTNGAVIASGASGSAALVLFGAALFGK
jgi:hypothetical protein